MKIHRFSKNHAFFSTAFAVALALGVFSGDVFQASAQTALDTASVEASATQASAIRVVKRPRGGSYVITVTNDDRSETSSVIVTDKIGRGLACPDENVVEITGHGVPEGNFTLADLKSGGIALGTLLPGQSAILSYSCEAF